MLKTKTKVKISVAGLMLAVSAFLFNFQWDNTSAAECTDPSCDTTFQVNVHESLSVTVTADTTWSKGDAGNLLRNKVGLSVSTNSSSFTAYMYSKGTTDLTNAIDGSTKINTLEGNTTGGGFTNNRWGYSLNDSDTPDSSATYQPMSTSQISILTGTTSGSEQIFFGAKADSTKAAGAYLGTVVFKVVTSGAPVDPVDPAKPSDDKPNDSAATYDNVNSRTVYTTTSSTSTSSTTTTQVTSGDVRGMYQSSLGETSRTDSNISDGSGVATGLAIAASTAAAGGMIFFILAKRREDDEEDEEELQ